MATRYERSLELQKILDSPVDSDEFKRHCMKMSLEDINVGWRAQQPRLMHAEAGYHIDDKLTLDSLAIPTRVFGEIILRGTVPEVRCMQFYGRYIVALPVFEPTVLGPKQEIEADIVDLEMEMSGADTVLPVGIPLRRPIYVPIEDIQFSMLIAA